MNKKVILSVSVLAFVLAGCSGPAETSDATKVVVSTTILGEPISKLVECAGGETEVLIPIGASDHDYTPSATQVAAMVNADLVVVNGLGLESGLADALSNAKADGATVFEVAEFVNPIAPLEIDTHGHGETHTEDDGHDHDEFDPHFWMDMQRMALGIEKVGDELSAVTDNPKFTECALEVSNEIKAAEAEVIETLENIPTENRKLVTDHFAFNYFAVKYGFEMFGAIIPSTSDLAAPSSAALSELAHVIEDNQIRAIFGGLDANTDLAKAVSEEVGYPVTVATLYTGSLGEPGSGADTYIGMMKTNAQTLLEVLG
ncbi:MAG: hypothetical protein RL038_1033 [Actinomycetota bacterium]|jgi:zinc/manganese transport system substrate-binding protein